MVLTTLSPLTDGVTDALRGQDWPEVTASLGSASPTPREMREEEGAGKPEVRAGCSGY